MHHSWGCLLRWRGQVVVGGGCHCLPCALATAHLGRCRGHKHLGVIAAVLAMKAVRSLDLRAVLAGTAAPLARGGRLSSMADLHIIHNSSVHLAPRALCDCERVLLDVVGGYHGETSPLAPSLDLIVSLGWELGCRWHLSPRGGAGRVIFS